MTADQIALEASRRVARMEGLTAQERRAAKAQIEADLRAEAAAAAQAQAAAVAAAEAQAERARIGSVIKVGANSGKAKQAARLALTGPLDAAGARALLATMPTDAAAASEALAIPEAIDAFGTPAAQAERRRIASIIGHAEAEGRFTTATALAFETALDPVQAVAALLAVPKQVAQQYQSLEQRSAAAGSFGPDFHNTSGLSKGERTDALWKRAVQQANASIGAAPSPAADTTPPNPSISDEERTALRGIAGLAGGALADMARG